MKKLQRKAKQEADQKSSGEKDKDSKDEKTIKQEPSPGDHSKLTFTPHLENVIKALATVLVSCSESPVPRLFSPTLHFH